MSKSAVLSQFRHFRPIPPSYLVGISDQYCPKRPKSDSDYPQHEALHLQRSEPARPRVRVRCRSRDGRRRRVVFASLVCQPVLFDLDRGATRQRERASGGKTGGRTETEGQRPERQKSHLFNSWLLHALLSSEDNFQGFCEEEGAQLEVRANHKNFGSKLLKYHVTN